MLGLIARGTQSLHRSRRGMFALACGLIASSLTSSLAAREKAFALSWSAPAECPSEADVASYVEHDLGAIANGRTVVRARGSAISPTEGHYTVELELDTGAATTSRRELSGVSCEEVAQAAALVVALTIRAEAEPESKPTQVPPRRTPESEPTVNRHARPFLAAALTADVGSLPKPAVGLAVSGGATLGWLRFEPVLAYFAPETAVTADTGEGAHLSLAAATLRACVPFPDGALWLAPCVGGGVDLVHASGFGADETRSPWTFDAFGTGAVVGGWDISPIISARLELGLVVPLARPDFVVDGGTEVYERSPVAARSMVGLELHF